MEGFWSADDNYLSWYTHLVVLGIWLRLLVKEGHKLAKDREIPRRRRVDALGHFDEDLVEVRGARYEQYDVFMGVVGGAELCLSMR